MKIVILRLNVGDFGKIGTYNVQETGLANALIEKGHEVDVLYLNRTVEEITRDEVYDYVYYLPHKSFGLHGMFKTKLLGDFKPDKVILFSDNQFWAKNVIEWCQANSVVCVHYFGNVLSDNKRWINQAYTRLILKRNRKSYRHSINIAKTENVRKEMELLKVPFRKVINIGLDKSLLNIAQNPDYSLREELGIGKDELAVLFVGRLIDYKKPLLACDILRELNARGIKTRLVIIGKGGMEEDLQNYISQKAIQEQIIWKKKVPYENIYKYMVSCDCCINLSSIEIFGMTILEAMYYGIPMVAHKAPGPNEIIEDGESGFLLDTDDPRIWADKILEAVDCRELLGKKERRRILDCFTWDKIADEFLEILERG